MVEDNPKNLKLVRDVLEFAGFEVVAAPRARRACARRETSPDLVLMDLQLPGIDGAEALRQLRAIARPRRAGRRRHGVRDGGRPRAGLRAGFDGYLEKPISVRAARAGA